MRWRGLGRRGGWWCAVVVDCVSVDFESFCDVDEVGGGEQSSGESAVSEDALSEGAGAAFPLSPGHVDDGKGGGVEVEALEVAAHLRSHQRTSEDGLS